MCVEAAVCAALDLPHSDRPPCVHLDARVFKITLNDSDWSSNDARAAGMRRCAVAQLGSLGMDGEKFSSILAVETTRQIVPIALRAAGQKIPAFAERLEEAAAACEAASNLAEAKAACQNAKAVGCAAANAAANAASDASDAVANAAYAAYAASAAAYRASPSERDRILSLSAEIAVQAFIACETEGSKFLHLCD
jgi:hypothetical protein